MEGERTSENKNENLFAMISERKKTRRKNFVWKKNRNEKNTHRFTEKL